MSEKAEEAERQPDEPLRIRAAAPELEVNFPQRTIELVAIPYEEEALVPHPRKAGAMCVEIVSRGAFDGVEKRANRVRLLRDHDRQRACGRAVSLHPSRDEGLVARLKLSRTPLGDETLELADDGILDASAGFRPFPDGEKWESRQRCRVTKAFLDHIALTPDPAYESANVLAVRHAASGARTDTLPAPTPHLDQLRADLLAEEYARLGRATDR